MQKSKTFDEIVSGNGPEAEVWIHLYSGLDLAEMELDRFSEEARALMTKLGERIFSQRTNLTAAPDDSFAGVSQQLLQFPWLKYAADLAFAWEAVGRAEKALDRYVELQPILTRYKLSDSAAKYLQEAGRTFLFSFDAACVAFCNAALEQTLRDVLVGARVVTERDLKRNQRTAAALLEQALQAKLLPEGAEQAARDLISKRNALMHRNFESLKDDALKAMEHLGVVLQALGRQIATDA